MTAIRPTSFIITLALILAAVAAGPAAAQYAFDWEFTWQGAVKDMLILEDFTTHFTNTSAVTDSFRVTLVKEMPITWQATICVGPLCYPPHITEKDFTLAPGESISLDFAITAAVEEGTGSSVVTLESLSDPAVNETNTFTVVTSGLEVLNVAADDGAGYEPFYGQAIDATGRTHGTWTRGVMGELTLTDLANFEAVVWFVGENSAAFSEVDRANLDAYVSFGGNLFLSGQNLARDFCWTGSPSYSPLAAAWFADVLGVSYLADDAGTNLVNGVSGDPIADGMALSINGGDGANNNTSPDEIDALTNGAASLTYATGQDAAVRSAYGDGRTFFTAFGFEGVAFATDRNDLMDSALGWIISRPSAVGDDLQSVLVSRPWVTPNPFNPQTSLKFEVGGNRSVNAAVVIYDLRGREVRNLYRGVLDPGLQSMVWNGRDNGGRSLSSGIYLARVKADDVIQTVKMTLAR